MLLKHSFQYFFARGIPGIINFASLGVFTRLLSPEEYGQYALVIAGVGLTNAILFQWLRLGLLRHWPSYERRNQSQSFLSTLAIAYLGVVILTSIISISVLLTTPLQLRSLVVLGICLLWLQAWYELQLEFSRSKLETRKYSLLMIIKTVLALAVGVVLVVSGAGATGLLVGLGIGMLIPIFLWGSNELSLIRLQHIDFKILNKMLKYGLPLTVTFALGFVVSGSDRLLLGWMLGTKEAGLYAVGYDLAQFTIGMLMMIVNLASYPLIVRALEHEGFEAARTKLQQNGLLLLAVSLPASAGLAVLSENVAETLLGAAFQSSAEQLVPLIALAALIAGIGAFYFNLAFQLGNNTFVQVWIALGAAGINVLLNFWWIPKLGILGAAYATFVAYLMATCLSWVLGSRFFPMPPLHKDTFRVVVASIIMTATIMPTAHFKGVIALMVQIILGISIYFASLVLTNVAGCREKIVQFIQTRSSAKHRV